MRAIVLALFIAATACAEFESATIVIDLRVLAVRAEPPEVLVPPDPEDVDLEAIPDVELCALVADPADSRRLAYRFTACPPTREGRCDPAEPLLALGTGTVDDPEEAGAPVSICATLEPQPTLLAILEAAVSLDDLQGFGGVDLMVEMAVWPEERGIEAAEYAFKSVRFGVTLPAERTPNRNPAIDAVTLLRDPFDEIEDVDGEMPRGRCADVTPVAVAPDEQIELLPVPAEDAVEDYVVPTFDGGSREFTENLTYHFYATSGDWTRGESGGPRDVAGNVPTTESRWRAPEEVDAPSDVQLWIVQRDERGGQSFFPTCVRVAP